MAAIHFRDAYVAINSVDMSDYVTSVTLKWSGEELDTTTMGATAHTLIGGLESAELSIEWVQDISGVDAVLWALRNTVTTFEIRETSASVSSSNPKYSGSVLVNDYSPMGNKVGELATVSTTWPVSGPVARATS